jgi:DNA-directed RNA polymerase alpha subunit
MSLFNPYAILGAVLIVLATFGLGYHKGYDARDVEMQLEIAKKNEEQREIERERVAKLGDLSTQLMKEKENAKAANDRYADALRTGAERLFVPVRSVQACPDSTAAGGDRNETRAELDPTTAVSLVAITNDGDDAIRQLNACIDAYNAIRDNQPAR